jgi:hypothetical protein
VNSIVWLQEWYTQQCNDSWEHEYGVKIETLDNPGWLVTVDLAGTAMQGVDMEEVHHGETNHIGIHGKQDWLNCKRESDRFVGAGGPTSLLQICDAFRLWVERSTGSQSKSGA